MAKLYDKRSIFVLSELKTKSKVIGVKQSLKAVKAGEARCVFFAEDADPMLLEPIRELCGAGEIDMISAESMAVLGQACGIDVGAAVVVLLEDGCEN